MTAVWAVKSAADRLDYLLLKEGALDGDLRRKVEQFRRKLTRIQQFLEDTDEVNRGKRDLKRYVVELASSVEDAAESYARHHLEEARKSGVARRLSIHTSASSGLVEKLNALTKQTDTLEHFMRGYRGRRDTIVRDASSDSTTSTTKEAQNCNENCNYSHPSAFTLVGMEHDKRQVLELLDCKKSTSRVVAVWGQAGSGKTTLVKHLYRTPLVAQQFETRAWVTVGRNFEPREVLETMLLSSSVRINRKEIARMDTMELMMCIFKALKGGKYLLVLDDVREREVWDNLQTVLPADGNNTSRIVVTTRRSDVAASMTKCVNAMTALTAEESWELFHLTSGLHRADKSIGLEIQSTGRKILEKCKGSPLAIVVIGGILMGNISKDHWKLMLCKLSGDAHHGQINNFLAFSYNELPRHLKPCFLYMGLFPPNKKISVEKLYLLWMAEGMISPRALNDRTTREVAEEYFKQLVDRRLVMVGEHNKLMEEVSESFASCMIHDVIHDLCIRMGKEEMLVEVINAGNMKQIGYLIRILSLHINELQGARDFLLNAPREAKNIRSILLFGTEEKKTKLKKLVHLKEFPSTRVLDFNEVDFRGQKLLRGIKKLIYLRYLSFQNCYLSELPTSISNLMFLETLDLRVKDSCEMTIPDILRELLRLKHLYFPLAFKSGAKGKLRLDTLKQLEILENINVSICESNDLHELEKLQTLTGIVDGSNRDLQNAITAMNNIKVLHRTSLVLKNFDSYSEERLSIVADLLRCNSLQSLTIDSYLSKLWHHDHGVGSNFTKMVFNGCEFKEDPLPILGAIPNLKSLVLCNFAFIGYKMVCHERHFTKLRSLKLSMLPFLEKLEVKEGTMSDLSTLTIEKCSRLQMPVAVVEFSSVQKMMFGSMPVGFLKQVKSIIQKRESLGEFGLDYSFYDC